MTAPEIASGKPTVSVIVPARNEEASLGSCLESLTNQTGVSSEIILVDDASTDRTREIAQSFPSVRVVDASPPPAHWTGKNNAMAAGAKVAAGEWLLFTDADTSICRAPWGAQSRKSGGATRVCFRTRPRRKSMGSGRKH